MHAVHSRSNASTAKKEWSRTNTNFFWLLTLWVTHVGMYMRHSTHGIGNNTQHSLCVQPGCFNLAGYVAGDFAMLTLLTCAVVVLFVRCIPP